ncbi:MAG TPA: hypothetical protein VF543_22275 [Pyrinomonadaceae bacterium]
MKYPDNQVWVLETQHGYYPLGTWGYATYLGSDETEARAKLEYWHKTAPGEYRLYNNETNEVVYAETEINAQRNNL